jgi:multiple sugar transport system ATP-binding protein
MRLTLDNLGKTYHAEGTAAVAELSLTVEHGQLLVLTGPSGCGKTTMLRLIAGLEQPTTGSVIADGVSWNTLPPQDREVALVFQNGGLFPHLNVHANLAVGLRLRQVPGEQIVRRVEETAELLGITPLLRRLPAELSGGERQRVALGRAIIRRPKLLLLDEPLASLDAPLRAQLRAEIQRLRRQVDSTIIYVTHDQDEALAVGGRLAVMKNGRLQQIGSPVEIYRRPANQFVAGFIGSPPMNFFTGVLQRNAHGWALPERGLAWTGGQHLEPHIGRPLVVGLRPENIQVMPAASPAAAQIESIEWAGAVSYVRVRWRNQAITCQAPADASVTLGQPAQLQFDYAAACFFDAASGQALA